MRTGTPPGVAGLPAMMSATMNDEIRSPLVDRFGQEVASQKGINLRPLPGERLRNRGVVNEGDLIVGLKGAEGPFESLGLHFGAAHAWPGA